MIIFDAHVHAREAGTPEFNEVMPTYASYSGAVYMMNFVNPLTLSDIPQDVEFCHKYAAAIMAQAVKAGNPSHLALIMPVLNNQMTPQNLEKFIKHARAFDIPLAGFKLFTQGQSTNSGYAPDIKLAQKLIDVIEDAGLPLALHLECPDEPDPSKKEEAAFRRVLPKFIEKGGHQRDMKISVEHISTEHGLMEVLCRNLSCTITPHHIAFNQEQFGITDPSQAEKVLSGTEPYYFCKPIIQTSRNQYMLLHFWLDGGYACQLMLGSDSAPHTADKKQGRPPAAGIYMGDVRESYQYGKTQDVSDLIEKYSLNAAAFYGISQETLKPAAPCKNKNDLTNVVNIRRLAEAQFKKTK